MTIVKNVVDMVKIFIKISVSIIKIVKNHIILEKVVLIIDIAIKTGKSTVKMAIKTCKLSEILWKNVKIFIKII